MVRTLNGMCCQGNLIGVTQQCKRFLEVVYSSRDISERVVHWSGTGAKGHGQSERQLLWEIIDLFLGDFVPPLANQHDYCHRKLENGTTAKFDKLITTKLNRTRLNKECQINWEDDSASRLFNGVQHMYDRINIMKSREKEVVSSVGMPNNMVDVFDNVMDYESSDAIVPNIDDRVFDEKDEGESMEINDNGIERNDNNTKLCVSKLYMDGWREVNELKVSEVRQVARDRITWKRDVTKYIMEQVKEMKSNSSTTVVCSKNPIAEISLWSSRMHTLRPKYYSVN